MSELNPDEQIDAFDEVPTTSAPEIVESADIDASTIRRMRDENEYDRRHMRAPRNEGF